MVIARLAKRTMWLAIALAIWPGAVLAAPGDPTLAAFVASYGEAPGATEGRMRIASIGVDAAIGAHRVSDDGDSPMPFGPADVAWYDFGSFAGLGGVPGEGRNAVFSGHVDYVARVPYLGSVRYGGPGVFARLTEVRVGDVIEVDRSGEPLRYVVAWTTHVDAETAPWQAYWSASVPIDSITIYTCAGQFDAASISYSDRVVVRAERVIGTPRQLPQTFGDYTAGTSGTNSPVALARAQAFDVHAIWKEDPSVSGGYRFWAPGVPSFVDTLTGRLSPDDYVILRIR